MHLVGVGTDVVGIARIARVWTRFGARFERRLLTPEEQGQKAWDAAALARRWALKEAVAKALGTGVGGMVGFQQIRVINLPGGAPRVTVDGCSGYRFHGSVSDDVAAGVAVAFCSVVRE